MNPPEHSLFPPPADIRVSDLLRQIAGRLHEAGIDRSPAEARMLVASATGLSHEDLLRHPERVIAPAAALLLARRRARHEPMAHILGEAGFWTLMLAVTPDTLIPRADTETLIEAALAAQPDRGATRTVLDLGTGTGCLLLAALHEYPAAYGVGVDRSPAAAFVAQANAAANGLATRCAMVCADWAAPLSGRFDLVLCNPPYIPREQIGRLMPEVAQWEPASALDGGADGLDAYRTLLPAMRGLLARGGIAIFEIGAGQAPDVVALAARSGLEATGRSDLAGHQRALILA